ncbi:MAG: hypothetical protein CMI96_00260 [Pelagibacteraceae bacterium]|nr:hypothetical protein [Pelagibacteraceae bacterium]
MRYIILFLTLFFSFSSYAKGYNVFGIGFYDIKFDGSEENTATDFRFETRLDKTLFDIGPEEDNFFYLKPFFGVEFTSDSASYFITGIYLEDNIGELFRGKKNQFIFTPSFGAGYYDDGDGKKLGNEIEFRTSFEVSYNLKNSNRIGLGFSHISNANIGEKNPGVEILSLSYQVPF